MGLEEYHQPFFTSSKLFLATWLFNAYGPFCSEATVTASLLDSVTGWEALEGEMSSFLPASQVYNYTITVYTVLEEQEIPRNTKYPE